MSRFLTYLIGVMFVITLLVSCDSNETNQPNIIVILTDDLGWGDMGYNGNQMVHTPTLDSLKNNSVVFQKFYVSPNGEQTLYNLLTGNYVTDLTTSKNYSDLVNDNLLNILKKNNYKTACFGRWYATQYNTPKDFGFEHYLSFYGLKLVDYFNPVFDSDGKQMVTKGYINDLLTDSLINYIQKQQAPFFTMISFPAAWLEAQVPSECFNTNFKNGIDKKTAAVYSMCENIDNNLKKIIGTLTDLELNESTILIFLSDNGPGYVRFNGGLKGRKGQIDEGGVRVPFIINYPGGHFVNKEYSNGFAAHIDLMPTLLGICNINNVEPKKINGLDLSPVLRGEMPNLPERKLFTYCDLNSNESEMWAVRTEKYLLTCSCFDTALFDLVNDPFQMNDIRKENMNIVDSLSLAYQQWFIAHGGKQNPKLNLNVDNILDQKGHVKSMYFLSDEVDKYYAKR